MNRVSVCMAVHNGERYLRQQIDSILPQLSDRDELIISDDCSTDASLSIITAYTDSRIRILQGVRHNSLVDNFEYALCHCNNEFIFLADQDDVWHKDKIRIMTEALESYDLVVCDCRIVDANLQELYHSFFNINKSRQGLVKNFIKSSFVGCCMAFRKTILSKALPFPPNTPMHDQWIGMVAERYFKVQFIHQALVDHRRHSSNYSSTAEQSKFSFQDKINMRLRLARKLFKL